MNRIEYDNGHSVAHHPGAFILAMIEDEEFTLDEFAEHLVLTREETQKLIDGDLDLNEDLAKSLSKMVGLSAETWLNIQKEFLDVRDGVRLVEKSPITQTQVQAGK